MQTTYEDDVITWANEQAAFLRSGKLWALDIEHLADEIEDIGKQEQRAFATRVTDLLAAVLEWQVQPTHYRPRLQITITVQRDNIRRRLTKTPSLKNSLSDTDWMLDVWGDAIALAARETELDLSKIPKECPWSYGQLMAEDFFPDLQK